MTITANAGPYISFGQAINSDANPEQATSLFWGGLGILDPRAYYTYDLGQNMGNLTAGWLGVNRITSMDGIPITKSATIIAAAGNITNGTPLVLASSTVDGLLVGASITRADTGVAVTGLLKLDPAVSSFTAALTSGSNVMTVSSPTAGGTHGYNKLCIGQTLTDSTTAANIPTGTTIVGYGTGGGGAGTYIMSAAATATASSDTVTGISKNFPLTVPFGSAGTIQLFNPVDMVSRTLIITANNSSAQTTTFTVQGFDVYGYPMVEQITVTPSSALTTSGLKAWKYIQSITPNATDGTYTFSVGTTDTIGLPLRSDIFNVPSDNDITINYNNAAVTASTGYTAGTQVTATATSGDTRGTYTLQTASTGSLRIVVIQSPLIANINNGAIGLYGVTPYANF